MAAGKIKGITITYPEVRESFFQEIRSLEQVEDLKPYGEFGFYVKVKNPVINYRHQFNGIMIPMVGEFNNRQEEHYDGAILTIPITKKYFHDMLEIMPIILTLKENNEKFKVVFNARESMITEDKIFKTFLMTAQQAKDINTEPLKYWLDFLNFYEIDYECTNSQFNKVISADYSYVFYYTDMGFEPANTSDTYVTNFIHWSNNTGLSGSKRVYPTRHESLAFKLSYQIITFGQPTLLLYSDCFEILKRNFAKSGLISKTIPGKKIFISRNTKIYGDRAISNTDTLNDYMESKGFEIFYYEDVNMMDQIKYVTEAECVAGVVGSNFLNAMYSDAGTQQIIFYPDKSQDWLIYSNQSARWDHEVKNIYTDNTPESMIEYLETTKSPIIRKWFHNE